MRMTEETHQKAKATHLKRNAYLYIRQSTPRQVIENTESTKRQYALRKTTKGREAPCLDANHGIGHQVSEGGFLRLRPTADAVDLLRAILDSNANDAAGSTGEATRRGTY